MSQFIVRAEQALEPAPENGMGLWEPFWGQGSGIALPVPLINLGWSFHFSQPQSSICKMGMGDSHVVMEILVPCACQSMVHARRCLQSEESELFHGEEEK